jgi:hypothetical protein
MLKHKTKIFFFLMFVSTILFSQSRTNLEVFYSLVDSSASSVFNSLEDSQIGYNFLNKTVAEYSGLNIRAENSLVNTGVQIEKNDLENEITYSVSRATVLYTDLFKDGFFGGYLIERKFVLSGEFQIKTSSKILSADTFYFAVTDTIPYDNIDFIENNSLPFTKSRLPDEPFFPSLVEPVIAITAVAVTVILFFSVRSK